MTHKHDEQASGYSTAEELRNLLETLIGSEETRRETATPDPEDALPEAQIPQLVTDVEETEQPTLSRNESPYVNMAGMDFPLIMSMEEDEDEPCQPRRSVVVEEPEEETEPPAESRDPFAALWGAFRRRLPAKKDATPVRLRKLALLLAVAVFLCSAVFLLFDMAIQPVFNEMRYNSLAAAWQPDNLNTLPESQQEGYPDGMLESFTSLYDKNADVRGWLTYCATSEEDFLSINYPVMFSGDNDTYRSKNFFSNPSKYGAPFFHKDNHLEEDNHSNKCFIIYGNNTADGQMFAGLNKLVGNVNNVRAAATMTLTTLFEQHEYKVIAVVISDEQAEGERYFDPLRTTFPTNGDFMDYIDEVRARSLFDFPVEVIPGDQLLVLTTEASRSVAKLTDARLTVIARKVRSGETASVEMSSITKNEDVIMPYAWYAAQGKEPHDYYESGELPELVTTTATTTTTTTTMTTTTTTTAVEETTGTEDGQTTATLAGDATDTTQAGDTTETGTTDGTATAATDVTDTTAGDADPTATGETETAQTTGESADGTTDTTVADSNVTAVQAF